MSVPDLSSFLPYAALGLKMLAVYRLSRLVSWRGAFLATWVLQHAAIVVIFLVASAFGALSSALVWILCGVFLATIIWTRKRSPMFVIPQLVAAEYMFGIVLAALVIRQMLAGDPTWDGQVYGLPRVALWAHSGSLFIRMPATNANLFTSEWNGELLSLFYGLAAHNVQGFTVAGIECMLLCYLAARFMLEALAFPSRVARSVAALVASTPAVIGLSLVVKGDLLACVAIMGAMGWLVCFRAENKSIYFCLAAIAAALAIGAKISAVVVAAGILLFLVAHIFKHKAATAVAIAIGAVFLSRYAINLIQYGHPLARVDGEVAIFGWTTLTANAALLSQQWVSSNYPPTFTALAGGLGVTGIASLLAIVVSIFTFTRVRTFVVLLACAAVIVMAMFLPAQPWSFRYFLPAILVVAAVLLATAAERMPARVCAAAAVLLICAQASLARFPNELWLLTTHHLSADTPLKRAITFFPYFYADAAVDKLALEKRSQTIALFSPTDRPKLVFFGSRFQNDVRLTNSEVALPALVAASDADIAVIGKAEPEKAATPEQLKLLHSAGCSDILDHNWFIIGKCDRRP